MIRNDNVDALFRGIGHFRRTGNSAVNRDDERARFRLKRVNRFPGKAVGFFAGGDAPRYVESPLLEPPGKQRRTRNAVYITVAKNKYLFPLFPGREYAVHGVFHTGKIKGIPEILGVVFKEIANFPACCYAPPRENRRGKQITAVPGGDFPGQLRRNVFFLPNHRSIVPAHSPADKYPPAPGMPGRPLVKPGTY